MSTIGQRISELGYALPDSPTPLGEYVPAVQSGSFVFTAGQLPLANGELLGVGRIHRIADTEHMGIDTAGRCAIQCVLNGLAAVQGVVGDLDRIVQIVKVVGFVAAAPGFAEHPLVLNPASEFLGQVFGENGRHARSVVGVESLPKNAPVEIEMIVEVSK